MQGDYIFSSAGLPDYSSEDPLRDTIGLGVYNWRTQTMLFPDVYFFSLPNHGSAIIDGCAFGTRKTGDDSHESLVLDLETGTELFSFPELRWQMVYGSDSMEGLALDMNGTAVLENESKSVIADWHTG